MGRLLAIRHGETDYNIERKYTGQSEIELNINGLHQAEEVAKKLFAYKIDVIYCSPMMRTRQTIAPYLRQKAAAIYYRDELKEINMGVFQGFTFDEVKLKFPEMLKTKPDGGEGREGVEARLYPFLKEIIEKHPDETVLLVTHGYIQRCIYAYFMNPSEEEFHKFIASNCDIKEYEY